MSIYQKEQDLFEKWPDHDDPLFCWDGLHFTGTPDKSTGYWLMKRDMQEETLWFSSPLRCLFLTKDHNHQGDGFGVDTRYETSLRNDTDGECVYYQFYARYLQLLYGLAHIDVKTFRYPPLEEACDVENYKNYFYKAPVVRINTKKIAGGNQCLPNILAPYIRRDGELIKEQIGFYDANVIVTCQSHNWNVEGNHSDAYYIMDLLAQRYPDMKRWRQDKYIYYSPSSKVIIIHHWHLSAHISYAVYYSVVADVAEFLKEHPNYLR